MQATDSDGNTKKKAITIMAVDITVEQPMALNYTSDTILVAGGPAKNIGQFYKFPNNTSSILAVVEMFYNGEWKKLGEATVSDSYTKGISVNPTNVFGAFTRLAFSISVPTIILDGYRLSYNAFDSRKNSGLKIILSQWNFSLILAV